MTTETHREKDTPSPALQSMAAGWLNDQETFDHEFAALLESLLGRDALIPDDWIDALARELDAAISDRQVKWVETLIAGRPYDTPLVEWEARDLIDIDDAKEIAADQGHRYG
jgi:hypothetical protein